MALLCFFVYYIMGGWCGLDRRDRQIKLEFVWTMVCEAILLVLVISDPYVIVDGCRGGCPMLIYLVGFPSALKWPFMLQLRKSNAGVVFPKSSSSLDVWQVIEYAMEIISKLHT
jgi:hypothetical protein